MCTHTLYLYKHRAQGQAAPPPLRAAVLVAERALLLGLMVEVAAARRV